MQSTSTDPAGRLPQCYFPPTPTSFDNEIFPVCDPRNQSAAVLLQCSLARLYFLTSNSRLVLGDNRNGRYLYICIC